MIITITNGFDFEKLPAVKAVRNAYLQATPGFKVGLKEALDAVKDGKELEIEDEYAEKFVGYLRMYGFNVEVQKLVSTITPEYIINNLLQKYLETGDVQFVYAACEMRKTFLM